MLTLIRETYMCGSLIMFIHLGKLTMSTLQVVCARAKKNVPKRYVHMHTLYRYSYELYKCLTLHRYVPICM